jgi:hypothetical protein
MIMHQAITAYLAAHKTLSMAEGELQVIAVHQAELAKVVYAEFCAEVGTKISGYNFLHHYNWIAIGDVGDTGSGYVGIQYWSEGRCGGQDEEFSLGNTMLSRISSAILDGHDEMFKAYFRGELLRAFEAEQADLIRRAQREVQEAQRKLDLLRQRSGQLVDRDQDKPWLASLGDMVAHVPAHLAPGNH